MRALLGETVPPLAKDLPLVARMNHFLACGRLDGVPAVGWSPFTLAVFLLDQRARAATAAPVPAPA